MVYILKNKVPAFLEFCSFEINFSSLLHLRFKHAHVTRESYSVLFYIKLYAPVL